MNSAALPESNLPVANKPLEMPSKRILTGIIGIFIAAIMAGLNSRVGAFALADIRGVHGFGLDEASWLNTAYSAGEFIAMPFAAWFAITLSIRRFVLWMLGTSTLVALILPAINQLELLLVLRFIQGIASGIAIPMLIMLVLKFLPHPLRLCGLALYAMTATFSPNLSIWLAGYWIDGTFDWRWVYWQIVPFTLIAGLLIGWGFPREPIQHARFGQANWLGVACAIPAFILITIALDQGVRLDWFNSPLITVSFAAGLILLGIYLLTEWYHPVPFIKLQILARRNLGMGCILLVLLLIVLISNSLLPITYLGRIQEYRPIDMSSIGLIVALPQLVLGFVVAFLLYQKWIDGRILFSLGLLFIALACFSAAKLSSDWSRDQFVITQTLQAFGQPIALVSLLFQITSVVQPQEGPFMCGTINTLRSFGSLIGAAIVGQLMAVRERFHSEMLLDYAALAGNSLPIRTEPSQLMNIIGQQSSVLSIADAFWVLGILALLLIPLVLRMTHIPTPSWNVISFSSASSFIKG
jgi:DHA2 family multidrug resistance protein